MASGTLGQASLTAAANTTVYTVPAAIITVATVSIANRNAGTPAVIDLAVSASGTPSASEYLLQGFVLEAGAAFEKTGIVMSAGKNVVVKSSASNTSVNVYGYEA